LKTHFLLLTAQARFEVQAALERMFGHAQRATADLATHVASAPSAAPCAGLGVHMQALALAHVLPELCWHASLDSGCVFSTCTTCGMPVASMRLLEPHDVMTALTTKRSSRLLAPLGAYRSMPQSLQRKKDNERRG
jgi:hypothetical protein